MKVPKGSTAWQIETPPHLPKLPMLYAAVGRARSGKGQNVSSLISMFKDSGCMHRVLLISPTSGSNKQFIDKMGIQEGDIFSPEDPQVVEQIIAIVEEERDQFESYHELLKA